jgi:23S rRNA (guanosine2251-2'-O)-methyltransferase
MRLICGLQPVREAIRAHGDKLQRVLVEKSDSPQLDAVARFAADHGATVQRVSRLDLDKISKGARHQGAAAFAPELTLVPLQDLETGKGALILALDELEDPQNFGAILRSAVAFGATAVMWPEHRSAPLSPATFRASAGAVEHAPLCRVSSLTTALTDLRSRGVTVIGLEMQAKETLDAIALEGALCLVVGAEGKGLRKTVKGCCDTLARLPMSGKLASLNASVAAAIALYEVTRQRTLASA